MWADDVTLAVDFEEETTSYTDWTFTNFATKQTNSGVPAHGGSYFGSTNGKTSGSLVTKEKLAKPKNIQFYISKTSTNNTASSWIIKVSTDGETWTNVKTQSASADITKGTWTEVTQDLTSYTNVYVGIFYDGTTAIRTIDDVTLTYENVNDTRTATTLAFAEGYATTGTEGGTIDLPTATVMAGETAVTGAEVTWKSSDESVAKIEGNKISLLTPGTATITATYAGDDSYKSSKATYDLTVTELSVEGLASMAIIFKDSGSSSDSGTIITSIEDIISEGNNYVSSIPTADNVYNGRTGRGLKLGASSKSATLKLTLAKAVKPIKITFDAMQYSAGEASITVNGKTITNLGSELATYSVIYDGETEVSSIEISTPSKRAYITNVKIYYEPEETTPNPLYIFGDPTGWGLPTNMTEMPWNVETQAYEYTFTTTGTSNFCFSETNEINENDWTTFNSTYRYGNGIGNFAADEYINSENSITLSKIGGDGNIQLNTAGEWTISVTPDMKMTITGKAAETPAVEDLYVIGIDAQWNLVENMTALEKDNDGNFVLEIDSQTMQGFCFSTKTYNEDNADNWTDFNGGYRYGLATENHDYRITDFTQQYQLVQVNDKNIELTPGKYTITITPQLLMAVTQVEAYSTGYVVAGGYEERTDGEFNEVWNDPLLGGRWDTNNSNNKMTVQNDGTYKLELDNATLFKGTYGFKIVKDGEWYGDPNNNGENFTTEISQAGIYNAVFTFNPDNNAATLALTKQEGDIPVIVVGDIFPSQWNTEINGNLLEEQADGTFKNTFDFTLDAGQYKCKPVIKYADYDDWIDDPNSTDEYHNFIIDVAETGIYAVTVMLDPLTRATTISLAASTKQTSTVKIDNNHVWTVVQGCSYDLPDATVMAGETAIDGATVTWSTSNPDFAVIENDKIVVKTFETNNNEWVGIIATYAGNDDYVTSSETFWVEIMSDHTAHVHGSFDIGDEPSEELVTLTKSVFGSHMEDDVEKPGFAWASDEVLMVKGDDGKFTMSRTDVQIPSDNFGFSWSIIVDKSTEVMNGEYMFHYEIPTAGTYDITFTYDPASETEPVSVTVVRTDAEEPSGDVTATWDFRGETPTPATLTKVNVESKATYYPSNNAIAALYVNALNGKLAYNSSGYAQFNAGTILRVPVYTTDDVVTVTAFPGQYKYTIGGSAATADETVHTATAEEVSKGYVEIVATGGAYLYAITMKTTQTAAKHAVWNFLNEIPTTITGTEINFTTGNVASSVEGIALDVNGYLKARGTDGWIYTNTTMNVPVKTEGDIVTVMAYSTQYDNYTVGGKDASNNESPIYTYKATTTDATNGYVTIATSDQQAYIYAISVQQLPVKEPTTLDNEEVTATFPFNLGTEGQTATFSEGDADYFLNSKAVWGSNFTVNGTGTVSGITETKLKATVKESAAKESNLIKFTINPKPGFTFTPTKVTFTATRYGTDAGALDIAWLNGNKTTATLANLKKADGNLPARESKDPNNTTFTYNLTEVNGIVAGEGECGLLFNLYDIDGGKNYGFANIIIEGTLSGTEQEVPILASFKVNGTEYSVEELFGDEYEATLKLSKSETMVGTNNPLTEVTAASGEVGTVTYDDSETACTVTIPVTAGNTTLDYVLNVIQKTDYMLTYYGVDGTTILDTETREEGMTIGQFLIDIANVQAKTDGYKARGWFKNNYVGEKWTVNEKITTDIKLYAVETEIEVPSDSRKYTFDLTDKFFYDEDHEGFNSVGNGKPNVSDMRHGWSFGNGDKIELLVGAKANIIITTCMYPQNGTTKITASNGESVDAISASDGGTASIAYEGEPGTLTLTFDGQAYVHKIVVMNTTTTNYEKNGDWIIVKAGDGSSFVDAIDAANSTTGTDPVYIFLPNGTYDLGQTTLTTIGRDNVSIIGQSMEDVIIKNAPAIEKEGIGTTATLKNTKNNTYFQDLTIQNALDYYTAVDERGMNGARAVALWDTGTNTICKNVKLLSHQDTYYTNNSDGEYYWETSDIHGTVDFICGEGTLFVDNSTLTVEKRYLTRNGSCTITAPSTAAGKSYGYVFNNCKIENSATSFNLGRAWNNEPRCAYISPTYNDDKLIDDRWNLEGMNTIAKEFVEYNPSDGVTENNVTFKYGSSTNETNTIISDASNFALDKVFTSWTPATYTQQVTAPKATLSNDGKKISWTPANDGATAYAIFKDGKFLGITTGNEWTIEEVAGAPRRAEEPEKTGYTIRAANSRGGFGPAAEVSPATGIAAIEAELGGDVKIYDLNGRRVMTPTKGVYIINGKKVVVK